MRLFLVMAIVGQLLRMFSLVFVVPLFYAAFDGDWSEVGTFSVALVATLAFGWLFALVHRGKTDVLHRAEALGVVAFTWLAIGLFGAIPYILAGLSFTDAFFEAVSGFTTTGATILTDFEAYDKTFFLWRSMTQWFGGLGVIALFVVVLPRLGIAGRQLFFAEASGAPGEAVSPQIRHAASRLWILYTGLTVLLIVLLAASGMETFDAICNSLTTLSAGGFSPNSSSIMGYDNATAEWILTVFMVIGGTSFPLLWVTFARHPLALFRDGEWRFYAFWIIAVAGGLTVVLMSRHGAEAEDAVRAGFFQAASLISSTGFASENYDVWDASAKVMLILIMLVGGCAGSAAGGPKAIRHLLVGKHILRELKRILHPRAIIAIKYKGNTVQDSVMHAIFLLVVIYMGTYFAFGMLMVLMGQDIVTGFTAALAAVGNVGPAFGEAGPMGSFAGFTDLQKITLTLGMWIGRLEIVTVLALFHWDVLRNIRLRRFRR